MLAWSMHTSPDLSRPHQKKFPPKQFLIVDFKYSQSPILTSSSADILLGCKGRKQPLPLLVIAKVQYMLCEGSTATRRRPPRFQHVATQWKSSWKGCAINLLATSGWVTSEALTGLYLMWSTLKSRASVGFSEVLKRLSSTNPAAFQRDLRS